VKDKGETITRCFHQDQPRSETEAAELLSCSLPDLFIHWHVEQLPCVIFLLKYYGLLFTLLITITTAIIIIIIIIMPSMSTSVISVKTPTLMDKEKNVPHAEAPRNLCVCSYILGNREIW